MPPLRLFAAPDALGSVPPTARPWRIWAACALVAAAKGCDPPLWVLRPIVKQEAFGASWLGYWSFAGTSTIALLVFIVAGGVLGDMFGRRRVLLIGLVGFVLGAGLAILPLPPAWYPVAAALLGVSSALMLPLALANIRLAFTRQRLPLALALYSTVAAVASLATTVLGPLVSAGVGWRAVYVPPLVVGGGALAACLRAIPESRAEGGYQRRDSIGISAWSLAILAVTYAAITVQVVGITSPIVLSALGVAVLGAGFLVWWERRAPSPILRNLPHSTWAIAIILLSGMMLNFALMGYALQIYNFFRAVKGFHAVIAALALAPALPGVGLAIVVGARLVRRHRPPALVFGGLVAITAALGGSAAAALILRAAAPYWLFAPLLTLLAAGFIVASTAWTSMYLSAFPRDLTGVSAAISNGTNQLGAVLASTLLGTLLVVLGRLNYNRLLRGHGLEPEQIAAALEALNAYLNPTLVPDPTDVPPAVLAALVGGYRDAYAAAFGQVLLITTGLLALCTWGVWLGLQALPAPSAQDDSAATAPRG